jgi:hypothetical protein
MNVKEMAAKLEELDDELEIFVLLDDEAGTVQSVSDISLDEDTLQVQIILDK